jgi:glycosyltransferase involved in cell wall biosynthesis
MEAMHAVVVDEPLRERLRAGGDRVATRFSWASTAAAHRRTYERVTSG